MSTRVRQWLPFSFGLLLFPSLLVSQTILRPGDLAVLGVNANLSGCGQGDVDLISFVCFRDIETGTLIDITDNGWERANPGQWGNSEGFVTVRRTGGTIPAGTVVTFRLPPVGQSTNYAAVAPDADWAFTQLSQNTLNFNSGGDQIYFMQGGEWDNGSGFDHNATYSGGVILFGFNTKTVWNSGRDNSQDSGLHPDVEPCYHMEPTGGTTDFISYRGPLTSTGQLEWITRIANAANWSTYPDCPSYLDPPMMLAVRTGDIDLACTICSGCDTVRETLRFRLPAAGGPFTVVYTDGTNEYTATGMSDGDTAAVEVTKTVDFRIVSVQDAAGCPVYSNFGPGVTVTVSSPPAVSDGARLEGCDDGTGQARFDLTVVESAVSLSPGESVRWFADAALRQPIADATAFLSGADTVFALVGPDSCAAGPVPVELALVAGPALTATVEQDVSCHNFADGRVRLDISGGTPPYRIDWSDDAYDNQAAPGNLVAGAYTITVTDRKGCIDSTAVTVAGPEALELACGQQQPVSQIGGNDGQARITIGGGAAPYALRWSGPAGGNRNVDTPGAITLDNLSAGNYSLDLTDANGCTQSCAFTISDPTCTLNVSLSKQDVSCAGLNDGAIDLTVSGGTAPFTFNWGGPPLDGQEDPSGLPAGTYTVVVSDAAGCTATGNTSIETQFPELNATFSSGGPVCPGTCFGFLLTLQGTPPFTLNYELVVDGNAAPRTFTTSNRSERFELCPDDFGPTTETIEVRLLELADANCRRPLNRSETIIRLTPAMRTLDTLLCAGDSLLINGVTYNAANPRGREVIPGGSVTGCDSTVTIDLRFTQAAELRIDSTLCSGESITVNGTLYDEGNPSGTEILKGGAATGCDSVIVVNLRYQQDTTIRIEPTLCRGQGLTINGTVYDAANPTGTERLPRGAGCDSILLINLRFVDEVVRTIDSTLCGDASLTVNGAVYDRDNPTGREVITGGASGGCDSVVVVNLRFAGGETRLDSTLCEGDQLTVNGTVYDQNNPSGREVIAGGGGSGCDSVVVVNLTFEGPVTTILDSTLCAGESLTVNGVVYDEGNPSGTETLRRLSGCDSIVQINLRFAPAISATLEGGGRICPGDSTRLTFRLTGGAAADVQYSDGASPPVLLNDIADGHQIVVSPRVSTTYRIEFVLVDGATCPAGIGDGVTVDVSDLTLRLDASDYDGYGVSCAGAADGSVRAVAAGSAPPLTFSWNTGAGGERLDNLAPGAYAVTVSDAAGCTLSDSLTLTQPDPLLVQTRLLPPTCPDDRDGAIVVEAIDGGAPPYRYTLNGTGGDAPVGDLPAFIRDIGPGTYQLLVSDANGCSAAEAFTVDPITRLELALGPDTTIRRGDSLRLAPRLNFTADSLIWSPTGGLSDPGALSTTARPSVSTTYTLTAFDPKGCRISDRIAVTVEDRSRIYTPTAFSPNDDGVNDRFQIFARADDVQAYTLRIFDRWGGLVFERVDLPANAPGEGWDGTVRGQAANPGVYVYHAEIIYRDGTREVMAGEITLIR